MAAPTATADSTLQVGTFSHLSFSINQTDLLAGTRQDFVAPAKGRVAVLSAVVQTATGTGAGTLTFKNETTNTVIGTIAVPASTTKGTVLKTSIAITSGISVSSGDDISITPSGFTTTGAVNGYLGVNT